MHASANCYREISFSISYLQSLINENFGKCVVGLIIIIHIVIYFGLGYLVFFERSVIDLSLFFSVELKIKNKIVTINQYTSRVFHKLARSLVAQLFSGFLHGIVKSHDMCFLTLC